MTAVKALARNDLETSGSGEGISGRPVILGEIMLDRGEDGIEFFGGSAVRVACHLQCLGLRPMLVTRVGDSMADGRALARLKSEGLDLSGVQIDPELPTVEIGQDNLPSEEGPIWAFDRLQSRGAIDSIRDSGCTLLYHSTAAARSEHTRTVLNAIRTQIGLPALVGIDLDAAWLDENLVRRTLLGARWIRIEVDDLPILVERPDVKGPRVLSAGRAMARRFALDKVFLQEAGLPVAVVAGQQAVRGKTSLSAAGRILSRSDDASAAALCLGLIRGWSSETILDRALELSVLAERARVENRRDPALYESLVDMWHDAS